MCLVFWCTPAAKNWKKNSSYAIIFLKGLSHALLDSDTTWLLLFVKSAWNKLCYSSTFCSYIQCPFHVVLLLIHVGISRFHRTGGKGNQLFQSWLKTEVFFRHLKISKSCSFIISRWKKIHKMYIAFFPTSWNMQLYLLMQNTLLERYIYITTGNRC